MNQKSGVFQRIKSFLYFPLASYFRFFAKIKLARWNPRVIVVTGSSGKTTLLHLIEAQLANKAAYSHHSNSAFGISFNILGMDRKTLFAAEWIELFLKASFLSLSKIPEQKIYIVEADCDRPGEGAFLSSLLKPEVTIWLSSSRTHSMNFDNLVSQGKFPSVEEAIAYEYGYFLEKTSKLVIANADSELINKQLSRTQARKIGISNKSLQEYDVSKDGSIFKINNKVCRFKFLLPEATFLSIAATFELADFLGKTIDESFSKFELPPGRSSIFKGIKGVTILDSCYNANLSSTTEIINMFNKINVDKKWMVIGDMLEQGKSEEEEHEKLAKLIMEAKYNRIFLLGPRVSKYTLPVLKSGGAKNVVGFESPKDVLDYLLDNIKGDEMILFKGARFLEGVIEKLLANKEDALKLARREKIWEIRRGKWGL